MATLFADADVVLTLAGPAGPRAGAAMACSASQPMSWVLAEMSCVAGTASSANSLSSRRLDSSGVIAASSARVGSRAPGSFANHHTSPFLAAMYPKNARLPKTKWNIPGLASTSTP